MKLGINIENYMTLIILSLILLLLNLRCLW